TLEDGMRFHVKCRSLPGRRLMAQSPERAVGGNTREGAAVASVAITIEQNGHHRTEWVHPESLCHGNRNPSGNEKTG
ncbi:MAG: hypothetical protein KDA96_12695, partial [Planctomycetaceae bacterium]|nr:hypothetical protein [Planctomycetaceae bacterium]